MFRFAALFIALFVVLFTAYLLKPVEVHVIDPFTNGVAWVSTKIIDTFDEGVIASGKEIISTRTGFGVRVERGCNGIEAVLLLFAAMFAFPAPWKHRFIGFALGFVAIQGVNLIRIISLFYIGEWETGKCVPGQECHRIWFEWFHLYLWQALIILDATVVWLIWLRYLPRTPPRNNRPTPPGEAAPTPA